MSDSIGHSHGHLRLVYKLCYIYSNTIIRSHYFAHVVSGARSQGTRSVAGTAYIYGPARRRRYITLIGTGTEK